MPVRPGSGPVTAKYGMRIHPISGVWRMHNGEDLGRDSSDPYNYAPVSGIVTHSGWHNSSGFGNAVSILQDGTSSTVWTVAHHAEVYVAKGGRVVQGVTRLGPTGATGAATGPHSHTERRTGSNGLPLSGNPTNPADYYGSQPAGGGVDPLPATPERNHNVTTLYVNWDTSVGGTAVNGTTQYALAGDSPGTDANWILTTSTAIATAWANQIGSSAVKLTAAQFENFKTLYSQPLRISGGAGSSSDGFTSADRDRLNATATAEKLEEVPYKVNVEQASKFATVNQNIQNVSDKIDALPTEFKVTPSQ